MSRRKERHRRCSLISEWETPEYLALRDMEFSTFNGTVPRTLSLKDAAALMGITPGGLRGAILRGKLRANKNGDGQLVVRSHNLAAYHLYGDGSVYPEEKMGPGARVFLHQYLETMCGG